MTNTFDGVKVFAATMAGQRDTLDDRITAWLENARQQRPGFEVVDIVVRQSSDASFHCIAICIFFKYAVTAKERHRG